MRVSRSTIGSLPLLFAAALTISAGPVAEAFGHGGTGGQVLSADYPEHVAQARDATAAGTPNADVVARRERRGTGGQAIGGANREGGSLPFSTGDTLPLVGLTVGLVVVGAGVVLSVQTRRRPAAHPMTTPAGPIGNGTPYPDEVRTRSQAERLSASSPSRV